MLKYATFKGGFLNFSGDIFYINIVASAQKSCIISLLKFFFEFIFNFILAQNRLNHTQLNVCEKEEPPCFL